MKRLLLPFFLVATLFLLGSCKPKTLAECTVPQHPEWSKNAVIYEVNWRQYTPEGTIAAFEKHLPRLKELGVTVLWFMPIHPIGVDGRKEGLGSYYSVKDYRAVNPEFGTAEEFTALVKKAHEMGFKVIMDWVANHTSRDHQWTKDHPDWYVRDSSGQILGPYDWTDVAQLDFDNTAVRQAMIDDMKYCVTTYDIDGFRCDVAGMVPLCFWETARKTLDSIKPMFMLAEDDDNKVFLNAAFDANYAWSLHGIMNQVAQGKQNATAFEQYLENERKITPRRGYRMTFTSNHDENSWNGTEFERMGDAAKLMAIFTYTFPNSFPLIYSGQEAGFNKRLRFFTKDTITWDNTAEWTPFYQKLIQLKQNNKALANGDAGGYAKVITNNQREKVLAIARQKDENTVVVVYNFSKDPVKVQLTGKVPEGTYTEWSSNTSVTLKKNQELSLAPWQVLTYTK